MKCGQSNISISSATPVDKDRFDTNYNTEEFEGIIIKHFPLYQIVHSKICTAGAEVGTLLSKDGIDVTKEFRVSVSPSTLSKLAAVVDDFKEKELAGNFKELAQTFKEIYS